MQPHHPASIYERQIGPILEGKYRKVADLLQPGSRVLELGCSTGYFSRALAQLGHDVTGLEGDAEAVDLCLQRGINAFKVDLSRANPFEHLEHGTFDAILSMDLLEHLPHPCSLLLDLKRVLKPGGRLIITGPNVAYWSVRLNLLLGRWNYSQAGIMDETHLRWFTRATWRGLLEGVGFKVELDDSAEFMLPKEQWLLRCGMSVPCLERLRACLGGMLPELFTTVFIFSARVESGNEAIPL